MALQLAAAALPTLFKLGKGISQTSQGKALVEAEERSGIKYTRPIEASKNLALTEQGYYNAVLPGQDAYINDLQTSSATGARRLTDAATSSGDLLDGINKINYNENRGRLDMRTLAARHKLGRQDVLSGALREGAMYSDQEFDYNVNQPHLRRLRRGEALRGAGTANTFGAATELASLGVSALDGGGGSTAGTTSAAPKFGKFTPSVALTSKTTYNPFTKKTSFSNG